MATLLPKQLLLNDAGGDLNTRTQVQLVKDLMDMGRHGTLRDRELLGDLAVAHVLATSIAPPDREG